MSPEVSLLQPPGNGDGRRRMYIEETLIRDRIGLYGIPVTDLWFGVPTVLVPTKEGTFIRRQDNSNWFDRLTDDEARTYIPQIEAHAEKTRLAHEGGS